jgi:hypothetical protein
VSEILDARAMATRLHEGDLEEDGASVLWHLARVAGRTPAEGRAIAWLHEVLERTAVPERALLESGVTTEELRALRLLRRTNDSHSDQVYMAHVELIARAAGHSGHLARLVKVADLEDRLLHPRVRPDGWSPPYARGLQRLQEALQQSAEAGPPPDGLTARLGPPRRLPARPAFAPGAAPRPRAARS